MNFMSHLKRNRMIKIRTKLVIAFTALTVFSAAIFIGTMYFYFSHQFFEDFRNTLIDQVSLAALQIDGDAHSKLISQADQNSPEYAAIKQTLIKIHDSGNGFTYPYTMRADPNGQIQFVVDTTVADPANIGDVYDNPGPVLKRDFSTLSKPEAEDKLYTDDWGTQLSAYAPFYRSDGKHEGVLAIDMPAGIIDAKERSLILICLAIFIGLLPFSILLGSWLARKLTEPLNDIKQKAQHLAEFDLPELASVIEGVSNGDLTGTIAIDSTTLTVNSNDELGELAKALNQIITKIIETGRSIDQMTRNLNNLVGQMAESAETLGISSDQFSTTAFQTGQATNQIAAAIQKMADGTLNQSNSVNLTVEFMGQMGQKIDSVAKGAIEQAASVSNISKISDEMASIIQNVAGYAHSVTNNSEETANIAQHGAKTVEDTIIGMQNIKSKVDLSTEKVREMGQRSENISMIVETIQDIASQTNLLALNAAIETARAETQSEVMLDSILNQQMVIQAQLVNQVLLRGESEFNASFWTELARRSHLDDLFITDSDGCIVYSKDPKLVNWRFPDDPKTQAFEFRKLIGLKDGVVCQKPQRRSADNQVYKYVGVSRLDTPGIVQIGFSNDSINHFKMNMGGFAIVAKEIRALAERSNISTKEITVLIKEIQKSAIEVAKAMNETAQEVETGSAHSSEAGKALSRILNAVELVYKQAELTASAAQTMTASSNELANAMKDVSSVVEENTAATQEMSSTSCAMTQAIENIAVVSRDQGNKVEDVSAGAEEISAQIEEVASGANSLAEMAHKLQGIVAEFKLADAPSI